jgi:hypothetical protein
MRDCAVSVAALGRIAPIQNPIRARERRETERSC